VLPAASRVGLATPAVHRVLPPLYEPCRVAQTLPTPDTIMLQERADVRHVAIDAEIKAAVVPGPMPPPVGA
jgi:hypothetical protein